MASDNLKQLGKRLKDTRDNSNYSKEHVFKNFPVVEGSEDIFGAINTFKFEFKTYTENPLVLLDVIIRQKFRQV